MRRVIGLENLDCPLPRAAVTIGKFFAVHRGHQALIQATVEAASRHQAPAVVVTFDRHPADLLRPDQPQPVLADLHERLSLIEAAGADLCLVLCVTPELLATEPEAFVSEVLSRQLGAVELLSGDNFRFGRRARGDLALLTAMGPSLGYRVTAVEPVMVRGERVSSSRIARCVSEGNVTGAEELLGRFYSVPGTVVEGDQVGRKLGFPTANVATPSGRVLPADGVYAVTLQCDGLAQPLPAVANLGVRPTRDGVRRVLEVHVLNWSGDLYGQHVRVTFHDRLRGEERFPSLEALSQQIARDVAQARVFFQP